MERRLGRITIAGMGVLAVAVVSCSCSGRASSPAAPPTAPSAVSAPTPAPPPPTPTPTPTPGAGPFTISLPIRPGDNRNNAFGVNPFGVHIGDHAIDGHPGWDIEYAVGATVVASADGTVQSVLPSEGSDGFGIQIRHFVAGREAYRTIYGVGTPIRPARSDAPGPWRVQERPREGQRRASSAVQLTTTLMKEVWVSSNVLIRNRCPSRLGT